MYRRHAREDIIARLIAGRIRMTRIARGRSQDDLARMAGLNRAMISRYESGCTTPKIVQLAAIARAQGIPIEDYVRGTDGSACWGSEEEQAAASAGEDST